MFIEATTTYYLLSYTRVEDPLTFLLFAFPQFEPSRHPCSLNGHTNSSQWGHITYLHTFVL